MLDQRLGFFNSRLQQRIAQKNISRAALASLVGISYEHVRKLTMGQCLPSEKVLERLCSALNLTKKEMRSRVHQDKVVFRFGDWGWRHLGIEPRNAPFHVLIPLLSNEQWNLLRTYMRAVHDKRDRT